eukprot:scaffold179822_cov31-Tisochrysis_lutea.AAC.14
MASTSRLLTFAECNARTVANYLPASMACSPGGYLCVVSLHIPALNSPALCTFVGEFTVCCTSLEFAGSRRH